MAKIWPIYEGKVPTSGERWADIPIDTAVELFNLEPKQFVSDLRITPRFGDVERDLTWAGYKHVVVEIEAREATEIWRSGFYRSPVKPPEAFRRLLELAFTTVLGRNNVVRLTYQRTVDSVGQDALRITVVLAPNAPAAIANNLVLDASLALQNQLREMRAHSTPVIIEYATEAELAQDAGA